MRPASWGPARCGAFAAGEAMNGRIPAFLRDSTAVVLCGGRSARMGVPKPQLFLDRIVAQLGCFDRVALSVRDLDQAPDVRFPLWEDCVKDCGPLGGLLTALKRAETPWVFVTPCDVPGITRAFIEELYGHLREDDPCLVPIAGGTLQPLIGIYNVSCAPVLERVLDEKLFRVRALLDRLPTHYARFDASWADAFFNVNTPEDYERWLRKEGGAGSMARSKEGCAMGKTPEIPVYSIVAWSGAGKTTLLEGLIPELKRRGLRVAVIKHDAHDFEIDREGKDTWRLTRAGADVTAIASASRAAVMENRPVSEEALLSHIRDVDLILTEGFKHGPWRKIGLRRGTFDLPPGEYAAVVSDAPLEPGIDAPVFAIGDLAGLADWIVSDSKRSREQV